MADGTILLVEDNPDDVALTLRALKSHNIQNEVAVARDGAEALDYLFGSANGTQGARAELPAAGAARPQAAQGDGLEVLRRIRATIARSCLPVVHPDGRPTSNATIVSGLPPRRQQLRPQARGLQGVHGSRPATGPLLAAVESRTAGAWRGT